VGVAVQYAHDHFNRTIGIIYRDGVATPAWKQPAASSRPW